MFTLNAPQILLLGGVFGAIAIASIADSIVKRAAALLALEVRENIWQREARASLWWRVPDMLGVILIVAGILKVFHVLKPPPPLDFHGMAIMAVGLMVVCLANVSRLWLSNHYYQMEAPGTAASRRALAAAVVVSLAGEPKFLGRPGAYRGRMAVRISGPLEPPRTAAAAEE